jgi:hypothetical protein
MYQFRRRAANAQWRAASLKGPHDGTLRSVWRARNELRFPSRRFRSLFFSARKGEWNRIVEDGGLSLFD